jgi:hypothetical protein
MDLQLACGPTGLTGGKFSRDTTGRAMSQIPLSSFTRRVLKAGYRRAYGKRYANIPPSQRVYVRPGEARAAQLRWSALLAAHRPTSLSAYAEKVPLGEIEEFLPCPMCENDTFRVLFHPGSRKRGAEWTYHVVRCERCGFLWRNPNIKPERLGRPLRGELQQVPHRRLCSEAAASLPADDGRLLAAVQGGRRSSPARLRLRHRALPRACRTARFRRRGL